VFTRLVPIIFLGGCPYIFSPPDLSGVSEDGDGDGYTPAQGDCDNTNSTVHPGAPELCDGLINDCMVSLLPTNEIDDDGDGYVECSVDVRGWFGPSIRGGGDCDDTDNLEGLNTFPGSAPLDDESACFKDVDDDDFGDDSPTRADVVAGTDCDDECGNINPNAPDVLDGADNDCDGTEDRINLIDVDAKLTGEQANDLAGREVAGLGDLNGDGYDDFAIGTPSPANNAGAVYVLYGSESISSMNLGKVTKLRGESEWDLAGFAVAGAGDINSDGYDDLLVGAPGEVAAAYILLGDSTQLTSMSLAKAHIFFDGEYSVGSSVSGAGDFNDDGFDDILVSGQSGEVYLMFGAAEVETSGVSVDVTLIRETFELELALAFGGDVDGDGAADVLVGDDGSVFLLLGSDQETDISLPLADARYDGEEENDEAGTSVAGVGDIDSDGYDDILVGAPSHKKEAGAAYLLMGSTNPVSQNLLFASTKLIGEQPGGRAGSSVAGVGDVNGDLIQDILVGAPRYSSKPFFECGAAYLILGPVVGTHSLSMSDAMFSGEYNINYAGGSVSGAGDVNGDGIDDLLVGAYGEASIADFAGAAYLILGSSF
jgi:hypothetical protein